jgi:hypothetical protein
VLLLIINLHLLWFFPLEADQVRVKNEGTYLVYLLLLPNSLLTLRSPGYGLGEHFGQLYGIEKPFSSTALEEFCRCDQESVDCDRQAFFGDER